MRLSWMIVPFTSLALALTASEIGAYTCDANGCTITAEYKEPSTVTTGSPLTNLQSCTVTYTVTKNGVATPEKTVVVPASSPNGGGQIARPITDAALVPGFDYVIGGSAACTNPSGTGPSSAPFATLPIARSGEVPPATSTGGAFK